MPKMPKSAQTIATKLGNILINESRIDRATNHKDMVDRLNLILDVLMALTATMLWSLEQTGGIPLRDEYLENLKKRIEDKPRIGEYKEEPKIN